MLFNSWMFVVLVLTTLIVYYLPMMKKFQLYVLLVASFVFYAYDSLWLLVLLLSSGFTNAVSSYGARFWDKPRFFATIGVVTNLILLASFKYGGLISTSFLDTSDGIGRLLCTLPLPLGISFYTFSGISLVVDSYKGCYDKKEETQKPSFYQYLCNILLYICFFPKLLAGPIVKSKDFLGEINSKSIFQINYRLAFKSLVVGYFLKMVIADNLKDFTFWMAFPYFEHRGTGSLLLMVFGYSIQMFADFAGYSLIAVGVAAIFGYRLPINFNFPYISTSFREFWKRWHITLSQFLMEYLYIALGGNRKGKTRTYLNLLLTMMLGGLWHGAAWSYLVWGTYHGLCLVVERMICGRRENCLQIAQYGLGLKISRYLSMMFVFIMISFGWLLFMLPHFDEAMLYLKCIFANYGSETFIDPKLLPIVIYALPVVLYHTIYCFRENHWMQQFLLRYNYVFYGTMLFLILTNSGSVGSFVYFQF